MATQALYSVPMTLAAPAAILAWKYLDARLSLTHDYRLVGSLFKAQFLQIRAEKRDRVNLFYVLEQHALSPKKANTPFLIYQDRSWTFKETYDTVLKYATWLKKTYGIKSKEIVALDFMNSPEFCFLWLALWCLGARPAFINYNLTGKPLIHSANVSTARLLFVDHEVRSSFTSEVLEELGSSRFRDGNGPMEVVFYTPELELQILQTVGEREPDSSRSGDLGRDMGILIYTSGTTGLPKPAIVSWAKCRAAGSFLGGWMGWKSTDRFYTCMPLYHSSAALLGFCSSLSFGNSLIVGHRFSNKTFWQEVRQHRATIIQYVGETCRYLLAAPPQIDPSTGENLDVKNDVRIAFGNGMRPDVWNRFKSRFNIETIAEFYAATEGSSSSWNFSTNEFSAGAVGRNGTLASLLLGPTVAIVELDFETEQPWRDPKTGFCKKLPRGEPGEVLYKIDPKDIEAKFQGYFNNKKATDGKIMRDVLTKGDAYFRTGDVLRWDNEGRWFFSDRIGDTYRWKSENVSTNEVSEVLGHHPQIHEANVYGVELPHHDGRAGCACIVFASSEPPSPQLMSDVASYVTKNLPKYAVPLFLRITREMQATGNNKQQKHILRSQGVDPEKVKGSNDLLYWLRDGSYVPMADKEWQELSGGRVRL